jgi:hypothetical protein
MISSNLLRELLYVHIAVALYVHVGWVEPRYPLVYHGAESYLNGVCSAPVDSKWVGGSAVVRSKVEPPPF